MNLTPDQIDKYLRNELSSSELRSFESAMEKDPVLQEQVAFDRATVDGISEFRKAQLKARLDAIDVSSPWFSVGQIGNNVLINTAGALVTATVIGVSAYLWINDSSEDEVKNDSQAQVLIGETDFPREAEEATINYSEIEGILNDLGQKASIQPAKPAPTVEESISIIEPVSEELSEQAEDFYPDVNVPMIGDVTDDPALKTAEADLPEMEAMDQVSVGDAMIDVKVEQNKKPSEPLKYKYFDGKLYLYGDFKSSPYEILEINRPAVRTIYLYFNNQFYNITSSDDVKELEPISNEKLLNELEIVRNNKQ